MNPTSIIFLRKNCLLASRLHIGLSVSLNKNWVIDLSVAAYRRTWGSIVCWHVSWQTPSCPWKVAWCGRPNCTLCAGREGLYSLLFFSFLFRKQGFLFININIYSRNLDVHVKDMHPDAIPPRFFFIIWSSPTISDAGVATSSRGSVEPWLGRSRCRMAVAAWQRHLVLQVTTKTSSVRRFSGPYTSNKLFYSLN